MSELSNKPDGPKVQSKARSNTPATPLALEATMLQQPAQQLDSEHVGSYLLTKQDRDLAFAASLLRGGMVTERRLAAMAKSWTAFGAVTLEEHAVEKGILEPQQKEDAHRIRRDILKSASDRMPANSDEKAAAEKLHNHLDPGGRLSKLLGLGDQTTEMQGRLQDRRVGASYTLLRKLGAGGLGVVWLARDENLQRYVAVKEISRDVAPDDIALEHFRREAEITGRLEHPAIVPVYQFGYDESSGKSFYAMRFLGKDTLQDQIVEYHERREAGNDDPMALHHLLTAFVSVCQAVGHAHSKRVIHRDLKPTNIALDHFGQVTLLDWGLAKVNEETGLYNVNGRTEPGDLHSVGSTRRGRVIGTPLYMAPEQAAGRLEEVDESTDVYGLGGILYAILTGVAPHQSVVESSESQIGATELLSRIVSDPVPGPQEIQSDIPPELNAICLKALSPKRYLRYPTATELAEDVQRYIAGTPVTAYEAPMKRRLSVWMAKHPTIAQAALLFVSLILIAGFLVAYGAHQGHQSLTAARYSGVRDSARDLKFHLQLEAEDLQRDLHFITELPLMRAITQSQRSLESKDNLSGSELADQKPTEPSPRDESQNSFYKMIVGDEQNRQINVALLSPDEWLQRQGDLYDGFLSANPSYLMMATCIRQEDYSYRELLRSERTAAGLRAHRTPRRQLMTSDPTAAGGAQLVNLDLMRPAEILLVTNDQIGEDIPTLHRSALVLSGIGSVYDADGVYFGLNVIELDLRQRLKSLLRAVAPENVMICVTSVDGQIAMRYQDGEFPEVIGTQSITEEFPKLKDFFAADSDAREAGDEKSYFATMVDLSPTTGMAKIGIVTKLLDPDD